MALNITPASEPLIVTELIFMIYGQPGTGKTTMALGAAKPLLIDFDAGLKRVTTRKRPDRIHVREWTQIANLPAAELAPYDTIVVDTAGRALDALGKHLMDTNSKHRAPGGGLTRNAYGPLGAQFVGWCRRLQALRKDLIFVCHSIEKQEGDQTVVRVDMAGNIGKQEVYKLADVMGHVSMDHNNKVVLDCSPRHGSFGKNPAQWGPILVPNDGDDDDTLARLMADAKEKMSDKPAGTSPREAPDEELDQINIRLDNLLQEGDAADAQAKVALMNEAQGMGLSFDKAAGKFVRAA